MAETKGSGESKTLEMRVAELEDKLSQIHISEEEMRTYQKVAAKLGAAAPCQQGMTSSCAQAQQPCVAAQAQQPCVAAQAQGPCTLSPQVCSIRPIFWPIYYRPIYWNPIYYADCIPGWATGGGAAGGGGGFGGLGT